MIIFSNAYQNINSFLFYLLLEVIFYISKLGEVARGQGHVYMWAMRAELISFSREISMKYSFAQVRIVSGLWYIIQALPGEFWGKVLWVVMQEL